MTSNLRRMLQAALVAVVVVWAAAARAADSTEPPAAGAAPKPVEPASAANFAASGQWLLSVENLFGYTYAHQSNHVSANTFTLLGDPLGIAKSAYDWPRLSVDLMVTGNISLGVAGTFARAAANGGNSNTAYEGAIRGGYALMPGPSLGIWARAGFTYAHQTGQSAAGVTLDGLLVAVAAPHLLLTFGPVVDIGVSGDHVGVGSVTFLNIGAYFGLTVPL